MHVSRRRVGLLLGIACAIALTWGHVQMSYAHRWGSWILAKKAVSVWVYGSAAQYTDQALEDWWRHSQDLYINKRSSHTDISAFNGNYGATGWWGLASIENYNYPKILHCHARFNDYYGGSNADKRGVQCQEIGHCFGLGHSNTGDCMGKGYYNNYNHVSTHNQNDLNSMY